MSEIEYDKKLMKEQADHLESYMEIVETLCCFPDISPQEWKQAKKDIDELIHYLRKGKGKKVYNKERYLEEYQDRLMRDE